jgi:hypothetical protein
VRNVASLTGLDISPQPFGVGVPESWIAAAPIPPGGDRREQHNGAKGHGGVGREENHQQSTQRKQ